MRISVDFAYRITVEDLDTGEKRTYLVPRGSHTFMEDPEARVMGSADPGKLDDDELPLPPDVPEVSVPVPPIGKTGLKPGKLGERISSKDAYGVPEG